MKSIVQPAKIKGSLREIKGSGFDLGTEGGVFTDGFRIVGLEHGQLSKSW
jgi:hypothetical protein